MDDSLGLVYACKKKAGGGDKTLHQLGLQMMKFQLNVPLCKKKT